MMASISGMSNPASITVVGTFEIRNAAGSIIESGLSSLVLSGASSYKTARITISGLTSLTLDQNLELRTESASSKITVNL